ncbi:class I SAM-dependent methyltransferase [Ammoniphilus sp. 3BR4]|uniref:class I SAM-dependent methyltransferase n=1 Tax=Ammoniphilus sp. 3BR4 TaxID=3158265 RepID=UPI003467A18E
MSWNYHHVPFKMDTCSYLPPRFIQKGAWSGHRRFGYDLVRFAKPRKVVELGTHFGTSFFTFCQAAKDGGLKTKCFALDTWAGDPHSGFYGDHVYQAVSRFTDEEYADIGILVRGTFDQSLDKFEDDSIDLLHIDGFHTFQAVLHDYTTWYRKLAKNGIILFHDIFVRRRNFGVFVLWEGLKQYPYIEFQHSFGLGVLFPKGYDESFNEVFLKKAEFQKVYK